MLVQNRREVHQIDFLLKNRQSLVIKAIIFHQNRQASDTMEKLWTTRRTLVGRRYIKKNKDHFKTKLKILTNLMILSKARNEDSTYIIRCTKSYRVENVQISKEKLLTEFLKYSFFVTLKDVFPLCLSSF